MEKINAVILAAGTSKRFAPLSYETPKGLLVVKGEVLIERQINQLHEAGISDITVVTGYMAEKFSYLKEKFGVQIVLNEDYCRYNNTSSLIRVLDKLGNTFICSSDNFFTENVFKDIPEKSFYSAIYAYGKTDEWCLETDIEGLIKKVVIGGSDSWYMLGHVFFSEEFSKIFKEIFKREYESSQTKDELWEKVYMRHIDELPLYIKKYDAGVINEFDSLDELRKFDESYIKNVPSRVFREIEAERHCTTEDIVNIQVLPEEEIDGKCYAGFSYLVKSTGQRYIYKQPLKSDNCTADL